MTTHSYTTIQQWDIYSQENHKTWEILFSACHESASLYMCSEFLQGLAKLELNHKRIPNLKDLSDHLRSISGWEIVTVAGLVPDDIYFGFIAQKKFPVNINIRDIEHLDFIDYPDLFHDVFGHIPLLISPNIASFIQYCGICITGAIRDNSLTKLDESKRLYWYTMEVGFVRESETVKILGSAIASSKKEISRALDISPRRFTLAEVTCTPFDITAVQQTYFCLDNIELLETIATTS